jgi:hypothetical protein
MDWDAATSKKVPHCLRTPFWSITLYDLAFGAHRLEVVVVPLCSHSRSGHEGYRIAMGFAFRKYSCKPVTYQLGTAYPVK